MSKDVKGSLLIRETFLRETSSLEHESRLNQPESPFWIFYSMNWSRLSVLLFTTIGPKRRSSILRPDDRVLLIVRVLSFKDILVHSKKKVQ